MWSVLSGGLRDLFPRSVRDRQGGQVEADHRQRPPRRKGRRGDPQARAGREKKILESGLEIQMNTKIM